MALTTQTSRPLQLAQALRCHSVRHVDRLEMSWDVLQQRQKVRWRTQTGNCHEFYLEDDCDESFTALIVAIKLTD